MNVERRPDTGAAVALAAVLEFRPFGPGIGGRVVKVGVLGRRCAILISSDEQERGRVEGDDAVEVDRHRDVRCSAPPT